MGIPPNMAASLNRHARDRICRCLHVLQRCRHVHSHYELPKLIRVCKGLESSVNRRVRSRHFSFSSLTVDHCVCEPVQNDTFSLNVHRFQSTNSDTGRNKKHDDGEEKRKLLKAKKEARKQLAIERQKNKQLKVS